MYRRYGWPAAAATVATGVFVDLDHLVDFAWTRLRGTRNHFLAPLHGWEVALALSALAAGVGAHRDAECAGPPGCASARKGGERPATAISRLAAGGVLAGLCAGLWLHLIQDLLTNRPRHAGTYSLLYRARHGFTREATGWGEHPDFHGWSSRPWYSWF
jgi:hypothetical protein